MKKAKKRLLSFALAAMIGLSPVIGNLEFGGSVSYADGALFTDVTGQIDMSDIVLNNLSSSVIKEKSTGEIRTVIVSLDGKNLVEEACGDDVNEFIGTSKGQKSARRIKKEQDAFLSKLGSEGIPYTLEYRYSAIDNAVAVSVNTKYLSSIKAMSGVSGVCLSETYAHPETVEDSHSIYDTENSDAAITRAAAVINKTKVYATGVYDSSEVDYTGDGSVVAVIDTGLDYTHDAFKVYGEYPMNEAVFDYSSIENILNNKELVAEERENLNGRELGAKDVYISQKIPFAYDYADSDADVYPSYSNHGTHVAGIVAGYDPNGYTDKDGNHVNDAFIGVAPEAQLVICKVFTDDMEDSEVNGAQTEDILAALEDCVLLGVDVINMSLGTSCGFSTTADGDDEGEELNKVYSSVREAGISLVCAASNDYSSSYGGNFGTNLSSNPDSGTVGSPSVFSSALSVASISGKMSPYMIANGSTAVYYEESTDQYSKSFNFADQMLGSENSKTIEYVSVPGVGKVSDYTPSVKAALKEGNRIALVKRGDNTFKDKVEIAASMGAIGIIVYNNVPGSIRMSLGDVVDPIPSAAITMDAGNAMVKYASSNGRIGSVTLDKNQLAGPFMSEFSSWGCTPDLKLKPEITAHGGEITSAVPGGYGEQSGTSMASPNMAGVVSIIRSYLKETQKLSTNELTQRVNQLIMSTANIIYDRDGLPYSPRKQGAGLGSLKNAINSKVYLYTENEDTDNRPVVNLGHDPEKNGSYTVEFKIANFGNTAYSFTVNPIFMTETLASDGLAVAEQAHILNDITPVWSVDGATKNGNDITVSENSVATITVTFTLSSAEKKYIDDSFKNGMFVEGFVSLESKSSDQCGLTLPFMGFYGDWAAAPMLDCTAYEVDASLKDSSVDDEDKLNASVWATQPYTMYYNEDYSMPMGSFSYLQDENATRVYTEEEHNALSCYNIYYGEDSYDNYLTAWQFRGLYVGLLRGARVVNYTLKNADTGEIICSETVNRVAKAYTGGSSGRPAFVKFELPPLENGLVSNGKYTMDFEFISDTVSVNGEESEPARETYSFSFYADYEAPVLLDARIRFNDYKDGNIVKQNIYLDLDIFDNHYAQSALLCYQDGSELKQVTEYVTPVYDSVKNGKNTVSIDITDIYEKYKSNLYLQLDDYALNHSMYYIDLTKANAGVAPDTFELNEGEKNITLGVYQTHQVSLAYSGDGNLSNFVWSSNNASIADVKNGEIVGLKAGVANITVSNGKGVEKTIKVTVTEENSQTLGRPSLSFSVIADNDDRLVSASGTVSLYPDQEVTLGLETDPWYYPKSMLKIKWESGNTDVAEVDEKGKLNLKKKGSASISATFLDDNGNETIYSAAFTVKVLDPFVISDYTLKEYRGKDKVVEIPADKSIMYIGVEAFKDNTTMEEVIIPKTVMNINESAFINCTALKKVYFVSREAQSIADADIKLIYRNAFSGCTSLETLDLSNVKVVTMGVNSFYGCSKLKEIIKPQAMGTAFDRAFYGCKSLTSLDLTGMHVAGEEVFAECEKLSSVTTGEFTAIGNGMFKNCTQLAYIQLNNSVIGDKAFYGCKRLKRVSFNQNDTEYVIGAEAFRNSSLARIEYIEGCKVRKICDYAFADTNLSTFTVPNGVTEWGEDVLSGNAITEIILPEDFSLEQIKLSGAMLGGYNVTLTNEDYVIEKGVLYNKNKTVLLALLGDVDNLKVENCVTAIYDYAFANSNLEKITIPSSVKTIGKGAFKNSKLNSITFEEGSQIIGIEAEAFYKTRLSSIELPESVTEIGAYAFADCNFLSEIVFGKNVIVIGDSAFRNCRSLEITELPEKLESLGSFAFYGCESITEITVPSAKNTGDYVFGKTNSLKKVVFGDNVTDIGSYTFVELSFRGDAQGCASLEKVIFGNGITNIKTSVFFNCSALTDVDLKNVTEIESYAFAECGKLKNIDLSKVVKIDDYAFYNCNSLDNIKLNSVKEIGLAAIAVGNDNGAFKSIEMPVVEVIGDMALYGNQATEITLPASLKELGYGVFASAVNLEKINVASDSDLFFAEDGVLYKNTDGGYVLICYPTAKALKESSYTVIDGTVRIDAYAFYMIGENIEKTDGSLAKIKFPYSLKLIGNFAFYGSGITEYTFESINAPALETLYNSTVEDIQNENVNSANPLIDPVIYSYYYSNFDELFVYYTDKVGEKSEYIINYPTNGIGYDNFVYERYFGTKTLIGELIDEVTRSFNAAAETLVNDETLILWLSTAKNGDVQTYKTDVEFFSETVKSVRRLYGNVTKSQQAFIKDGYVERLNSVEEQMRTIKKLYGVAVKIKYITANEGYKADYVEGETFDISGLSVTVSYDDGSTEIIDSSKLTLVSTGALHTYNSDVTVSYTNENGEITETFVTVNVKAADENEQPTEEPSSDGCGATVSFDGYALVTLLVLIAITGKCISTARKNTLKKEKNNGEDNR